MRYLVRDDEADGVERVGPRQTGPAVPKEEGKSQDPPCHQKRVKEVDAGAEDRSHRVPVCKAGSEDRAVLAALAREQRVGDAVDVSRRTLLGLLLVVGIFVVDARAIARSYTFPVSDIRAIETSKDVERHTLVARDGVAVNALELRAPLGARTIVHFHNNRETAASQIEIARAFHARGLGVLLVEYRGYGASRGTVPSEEGLYLDAECALDMLAKRGVGPERVVLWGTSLGTGVAAEMARRGRGARLVLVTPYTSIPELVTDVVPIVPAWILVPDHFDTLAKADDIHTPTLVIHGDADEIVPFSMGERVARAIHGARIVRIARGHHGDLFVRDGKHLLAEMAAFSTD